MSTLAGMDRAHVVLIESRLDSIERNLMDSHVPRGQRNEIVQAVERQVYGLLEAHDGELTREVVLRVLGSLEPPEAYCCVEPRELPVRAAQYAAPPPPAKGGLQPVPPACCATPHSCPTPPHAQHSTSSFAFAALVLAVLSIPAIIVIPIGTILALAGAICGGIAWFQISSSGGRLGGKWMAVVSFVVFALHLCVICYVLVAVLL